VRRVSAPRPPVLSLGSATSPISPSQARLRAALDAEAALYSFYLYTDRDDGATLRLGFGKHVGVPLLEAEPSYLQHVLGFDSLPPAAAGAMRDALKGRRGGGTRSQAEAQAQAEAGAEAGAGAEAVTELVQEGAEAQGGGAPLLKKASETDAFASDAEKLAYRMAQARLRV
jgi:hypothetical protein